MAKEKYLVLDSGGFILREERFSYNDVESIGFYYVQTQKRLNFVASGVDHNIDVSIYVRGRSKPLKICSGPQYVSFHNISLGKDASEHLLAKYHELCVQTFEQRASRYLYDLKSRGYFLYDGKRILASGEVQCEKWNSHLVNEAPWLKMPFKIFRELRSGDFFKRPVRHEIATLMDSDVFFSMLDSIFGLRWK